MLDADVTDSVIGEGCVIKVSHENSVVSLELKLNSLNILMSITLFPEA